MSNFLWRKANRSSLFLSALCLGASCTEAPYAPPAFPFLASYDSSADSVPRVLDNVDWWRGFNDPVLDQLVEQALSGSLSLELARERVIEARAARDSLPQAANLASGVGVKREYEGFEGGEAETRAEATLGFDWLLDIYGTRRAQVEAAGARVAVADAEVDAARLLLLLNLTNAYIDLRFQQTSLQLRRSELRSRRQTLDLVQTLLDADSATRIDLVFAQALVSETQASIPGIEAAISALRNEIAVLSGRMPGEAGPDLDLHTGQPSVNLSPKVGIPADLLRNRPYIRVAERSYYAALREVKSASAALYPQLSLGGTISLASLSGDSDTDYIFGPSLRLPILPLAAGRASVELRESRVRQAHTSWRLTVLAAIGDVESALGSYSAATRARGAAAETVRLYTEALNLTRESVNRDAGTIRDVIDSEQDLAVANSGLANALREVGRSYIALNVNLGAGNRYGMTGAAQATDMTGLPVSESGG